jgi:hypothetical protein
MLMIESVFNRNINYRRDDHLFIANSLRQDSASLNAYFASLVRFKTLRFYAKLYYITPQLPNRYRI